MNRSLVSPTRALPYSHPPSLYRWPNHLLFITESASRTLCLIQFSGSAAVSDRRLEAASSAFMISKVLFASPMVPIFAHSESSDGRFGGVDFILRERGVILGRYA